MPQPGEVWIADIPFTSGTASKLRPVLVLWTARVQHVVHLILLFTGDHKATL